MRKIILLCMGIGLWGVVCLQSPKYSNEELLQLFKEYGPFDVLYTKSIYNIDIRASYSDTLLKSYFMKLLDPVEFAKYKITKRNKEVRRDTGLLNRLIIYNFKGQDKEYFLDSIFNDSVLLKEQRDSAFREYTKGDAEEIKNAGRIAPRAFNLHGRLAYPESYTIIKEYLERGGRKNHNAFLALLRLEDPEAQEYLAKKIRKAIETGDAEKVYSVQGYISRAYNMFAVKWLLKMLPVEGEIYMFGSDGPATPLKCRTLKALAEIIFTECNIKIGDMYRKVYPCEKLRKREEEIKQLAKSEELRECLEKRGAYWKKNIEYIYTEKDK